MAEIAAPTPVEPAPVAAKPVKRLALRLDDGTVIQSSDPALSPTVLKPKEAWEAGLLNESHLLRMQALLCELHAKLPDEGPLKSISLGSKRSFDSVLEVHQAPSKKSHSVGEPQAPAAGPPPQNFGGDSSSNDWVDICKTLLQFLISPKVLDADAARIFRNPPNLAVVPMYGTYIAEPIWFDKISEKLSSGAYAGPEGFYRDMLLLCDNCYKFNVELYPSSYGTIGVKLENTFLAAWGKTPFAATVPPRGFRPNPPALKAGKPPKKPSAGRVSGGGGGAPPRAPGVPGRGRGRPGRPPGVLRPKPMPGYYGAAYPPAPVFSEAMQTALLAALHDETVLEANMQGVIDILQGAGEMGEDENGEPTLDLEKVTPPTATKLYDLVVVKTGRAMPVAVAAPPAYRQLDGESDDDDWDMDDE